MDDPKYRRRRAQLRRLDDRLLRFETAHPVLFVVLVVTGVLSVIGLVILDAMR
jgi:hypothetical protein